ncbi:CynX/NimT family MFS transporter [Saccharopolyspora phatthalungensis]|uniref:CP family cyanate transporter-like MFS transporter n=1 Tax=Saccharopolyspora phatthalungensis TaxID=664693 RepID=A0A840Q6H0_9PSEU|nr:MFS transporter [Saccharopolyspora phatthalungensis]MBB5155557.1 CP family cyanate transporter-like MFS transporter [Saccharopolyspora phatthalungensis]
MADQNATPPAADRHPDALSLENEGAAETVLPNRHVAVAGGGLLLAGVALAAANMRPAVTSLASVLGEVRDSLGASSTWASVVTSVPTLCFGLAGIGAPLLARRMGINKVVGGSLAVLTGAMLLRVVNGPWAVLGGTVLVCAAIAMCNVLIPVVVKESFPTRVGMATALYTTAMAAGGSAGSALTPYLNSATGSWRLSLATWAVVALTALCVWLPATARRTPTRQVAGPASKGPRRSLMRSPLAWVITIYFALQSLVAYVVMGWMPEVLKDAGMDGATAGMLLGLLLLVGVPSNMILPPLVTRTRSQSGWAIGFAVLTLTGVSGLLLAPMAMPVVWALAIGVGMSGFPLALVFISLRTVNAADTGALSAMSQSIGYLISSVGPFLFGVLHDVTGTWSVSLSAIVVLVAVQAVFGVIAGRPRTI